MESIVPYAIWTALILAGLGVVSLLLFSIRNVFHGKIELLSMVILAVPGVIVVIMRLIMDTWAQAAIGTLLAMFALTILGLLLSGVRSMFT